MPFTGPSRISAITPDRQAQLLINIPEASLARAAWAKQRTGPQMGRAVMHTVGGSIGLRLMPSGAWALQPHQDKHLAEWSTYDLSTLTRAAEVEIVSALALANAYKSPGTDLIGCTADAAVMVQGDGFLIKRVPAGDSWDFQLTADALAFSSPVSASNNFPMDRVLHGKKTYPANQGYCLRFIGPGHALSGFDNLCTFLFGGDTTTDHGGNFGATLHGDGTGILYEKHGTDWRQVHKFRFADPRQVANQAHVVIFQPHRGDVMEILTSSAEVSRADHVKRRPTFVDVPAMMHGDVYRHSKAVSGYSAGPHLTGPGIVRFDQRRDLRFPFQLSLLWYATTGTLTDTAVVTPPQPNGTSMTLTWKGETPPGTTLVPHVYRGDTNAALVQNTDGTWPLADGVRTYYVAFDFTGDGSVTPFLRQYELVIDGIFEELAPTPITANVSSYTVTGPDLVADHETASCLAHDPTDAGSILRTRGRIHCKLQTSYDQADPTKKCVMFEGENIPTEAAKWGKMATGTGGLHTGATRLYPSPEARSYDLSLCSMWSRIKDQYLMDGRDYTEDPAAAPDASGNRPPWKVTDIIRNLFLQCGVPDDQLDVPDVDLRAPLASRAEVEDYYLLPTASIFDHITRFARDYLGGWFVVYDPNAGTRGTWRLLPPTTPDAMGNYNVLWNFQTAPATTAGHLPYHPGSYASRTTFIQRYSSRTVPPEANYIIVSITGELLPGDGGATLATQTIWNPVSFNLDPDHPTADPTHPDYLGRKVPLIYIDATLAAADDPQAVVNLIIRRLYQQTAHAQKWLRWRAPLVLMDVPGDALLTGKVRPLRVYDAVKVNGQVVLVRSVNIEPTRSDRAVMATYEGLAADNTQVF